MIVSRHGSVSRQEVQPGSKTCFTIAAVALGAALLGVIVNHFLTDWMAAGGMAMVGVLYLGMGLIELCYERMNASDRSAGTQQTAASRRPESRAGHQELKFTRVVHQGRRR